MLLDRTDMRMLQWIDTLGVSLKDTKRNEVIRKTLGVTCITDRNMRCQIEMARENESSVNRIVAAEVTGHGSRGRQKKR